MIYLDSCALLKMIKIEPDHRALAAFLNRNQSMPIVSSELLAVEVRRALTRYSDDELPDYSTLGDELIEVMDLIGMTAVVQEAGTLPPASMRSLDAIHLATALYLGNALNAFITYDKRLEEAAVAHQLPVVVPKDE